MTFSVANNRDIQTAASGLLTEDKVRRCQLQGVADTGAAYLVLPQTVADQLGCPPGKDITVTYADRRTAKRAVIEEVQVELCGRHGTFRAIVEPDRNNALIGAIVLEDLDLIVDCQNQEVRPRDPDRMMAEIE